MPPVNSDLLIRFMDPFLKVKFPAHDGPRSLCICVSIEICCISLNVVGLTLPHSRYHATGTRLESCNSKSLCH